MNDIDQRLHELGSTIRPPAVPLEEDLARGRRRLGMQRILTTGGAVAGVAVIALGVTVVANLGDDGSSLGPASAPTSAAPDARSKPPAAKDQRTGGELLKVYRDVIAEYIDPANKHLQMKPDNLQSGGGLGTKLGWTIPGQDGLGMVEVFVGGGWNGFVGASCGDPGTECSQTNVDGIDARIVEWNGSTSVVVEGSEATVAITVNALFGNNSLIPVEGMDIPLDDLVRAAADERLTPATPEQIRNAGTSMGFPDMDELGAIGEGASDNPVPTPPAD